MNAPTQALKPLKTWSHFANRRKKPSEYEIVSVGLHTTTDNPDAPFELDPNMALARWFKQYRNASPLQHPDWNQYRDPAEMTYRVYNIVQDGQESFVNGVFDQMSERGHDSMLERTWAGSLARLYSPMRYLFHTLQMMSAYVTMLAPASTISNCASYQTGDHFRWVTHTAYRTAELARTFPDVGFGRDERHYWENDPAWQGLRELVEKALATWDWAESFAVLNLVVKPCIEEGVMLTLADAARHSGDTVLPLVVDSQINDARRHRRWAGALATMALEQPGNREVTDRWLEQWMPLATRAVQTYCAALPDGEAAAARAIRVVESFQRSAGLRAE
jgi:toluene monooxygenase system protein E